MRRGVLSFRYGALFPVFRDDLGGRHSPSMAHAWHHCMRSSYRPNPKRVL